LFFKGYVHFPIINVPEAGIKLEVILYEGDVALRTKELNLTKEDGIDK
jgi:hypothetical protein